MNSSSCTKRYENYQCMENPLTPLQFNCANQFSPQQNPKIDVYPFSNTNDWTGFPLIKFSSSSPLRRTNSNSFYETRINNNNNGFMRKQHGTQRSSSGFNRREFNNISNSNVKNLSNVSNDENARTDKIDNFITQKPCDNGEVHIALNHHGNGTCLPRIIKPRKRRKKDRKPTNNLQQTVENTSSTFPFTFSTSTNETMQNLTDRNIVCANENNNKSYSCAQDNIGNLKPINCDGYMFSLNNLVTSNVASSSSISSSPVSLSNSSLSSSANSSSCSCQLCDPNCKIWSFPLRRSFSDNSASKMDFRHMYSSNTDNDFNIGYKKDVGVIGSNRSSKNDGKSCTKSLLTLMDIIETEQQQQQEQNMSPAIFDDSECSLVLNNLRISDDIISSTIKTVNDNFSVNEVNAITQQLSSFNLLDSNLNENNETVINNSSSSNTPKFENFLYPPSFSSADINKLNQQHYYSENLFSQNLAPIISSNRQNHIMVEPNQNSYANYDSKNLKFNELLGTNLLIDNVSKDTSYFKKEIENISLFI